MDDVFMVGRVMSFASVLNAWIVWKELCSVTCTWQGTLTAVAFVFPFAFRSLRPSRCECSVPRCSSRWVTVPRPRLRGAL